MKSVSINLLNEIDPFFWKEYWEKWPDQVLDANSRNIRPSTYSYKKTAQEINKILGFKKTDLVLDVGCGTGETIKEILPLVSKMVGVDNAESMLRYAKENLEGVDKVSFKKMEANDIVFPKASFNKVISIGVIQYIHKDFLLKYIQDMLFVTKKGGKVLIGDIVPEKDKHKDANVTMLPREYWRRYWKEYNPVFYRSGYEDRYHVVLSK